MPALESPLTVNLNTQSATKQTDGVNGTSGNLGHIGLPHRAMFVVQTDGTGATNVTGTVTAIFEFSIDNGTSWVEGGRVDLQGGGGTPLASQMWEVPVGFRDLVPELANHQFKWRLAVNNSASTTGGPTSVPINAFLGHSVGRQAKRS